MLKRRLSIAQVRDYAEGGIQAISTVRKRDPSTYVRLIAQLLPKEALVEHITGSGLTAEQRVEAITALRQMMIEHRKQEAMQEKLLIESRVEDGPSN